MNKILKNNNKLICVVHAYNPSTGDPEVGGSQVLGQLVLHSKFKTSLSYMVKCCLKKRKEIEKKENAEINKEVNLCSFGSFTI
jgi:hypothetical protein